jgi:hypothetical protein
MTASMLHELDAPIGGLIARILSTSNRINLCDTDVCAVAPLVSDCREEA